MKTDTPLRTVYRMTGHPPPIKQIQGQIRTSSDVTYGKTYLLDSSRRRIEKPVYSKPRAERTPDTLADQTYEFLTLWPEESPLPTSSDLAAALRMTDSEYGAAIQQLITRGRIVYWRGSRRGYAGQQVIQIPEYDTTLRTAHAPLRFRA